MSWLSDLSKGTPWGPMETGKPQNPALVTSPWDVQGMDQTGQRQAMQQRIAQGAGRASENANASLQRAGISGGADAARASERIAGAQANSIADSEAQLQQQDYAQRMGLAQMMNQTALQNYGISSNNYNQEQQGRNQFWGGLMGAGAQLGGAYLGSRNNTSKKAGG